MRDDALADDGDRALAMRVDERDRAALRGCAPGCANVDVARAQLGLGAVAEVVVAERGVQRAAAGPAGERDRGDGATAGCDGQARCRVDDLAGARHVIDIEELDDLDVADDRDARHWSLGLAESPR